MVLEKTREKLLQSISTPTYMKMIHALAFKLQFRFFPLLGQTIFQSTAH
jgi:hypothetical protein